MKAIIRSFLGNDPQTTIYGFVSKTFLGIILVSQLNPDLLRNTIGPAATTTLVNWCALIWFVFGVVKDRKTKDAQPPA